MLFAVLAVVAGACSDGGADTNTVSAIAPKLESATTTTTAPPTDTTSVTVAGTRIQRVRTLPAGEGTARPAKAPKAAAYRGPTPTGRIAIPRIGLDHLTYEGLDLAIIDYGPSHWPGTAMPGQVGNTVFPGHRVTHSRPFYNIDLVQIGDEVIFTTAAGKFTYHVTESLIVNADETWIANETATPTMTIFGCHPKHSAKQRYVLKGDLVKSERAAGASGGSGSGGGTGGSDGGTYTTAPDPAAPEETTPTTQAPSGGIKLPIIGKR